MPLLNACTFEEQQVLNKIPEQVNVQSVDCFVDETDSLGFEDVLINPSFKKFNGPEIGYGHLRKNLWVRLVLQNKTNQTQDAILSTDQIILEKVDFYKKKEGKWHKEEAGWGIAVQYRELPSYLHAFKISLMPNASDTVYYRVRNQYQVVRLPLNLFNQQQFYQHYHSYLFYDGLVTMALITAILYCLYNLFYSSQKDRKTLVLYPLCGLNKHGMLQLIYWSIV
ncbi:7TMR-DISMED2 domain-containing protein [Lacihabitans soyangensis]|uniref:7TMR-DISMED2 domain-containing protein n=1 Tax=Lacihabitans soyangensis TaxID=869394 RepID=UPI0020CB6FC2|nr:7TM-DISM domain-containing protein [Lacihabitans soyangensis]